MEVAVGGFVVADLQIGAVGGKARFYCACDARGEVPACDGCAVEDDLRLVFVDEVVDYFGVAVCLVLFRGGNARPR